MTTTDRTIIRAEYDFCGAASRKSGELRLRTIPMASSVADTAADLGRKAVNRVETVTGDDAREIKSRANHVMREFRNDYRYYTGSSGSKKTRKPDPRKYKRASGNGR
jgi:hypothetical protein